MLGYCVKARMLGWTQQPSIPASIYISMIYMYIGMYVCREGERDRLTQKSE